MRKIVINISLFIAASALTQVTFAQSNEDIINWYNGKAPGMETDAAYKLLKGKTPKSVIVAVIDSGIDIEHEDLKGKIWINSDEIPKNGIDDDKNGYVDDVYGWNFLGNSKGENLNEANLEKTRILRDLSKKFNGVRNILSNSILKY
jgi:subtilisin family serine protease